MTTTKIQWAVLLTFALLGSSAFAAPVTFQDASAAAGIDKATESYGASWGELNGDGCPDLFVSNHREQPEVFLNRCDGTFWSNGDEVVTWVNRSTSDTHGGSWADFDNDGDQDLLISAGTGNVPHFLVNERGELEDRTIELGFDAVTVVGGRLPVWFDYSGDGLLDVLIAQFGGNARLLEQNASGGFTETSVGSALSCPLLHYGQLLDVDSDRQLDFICGDLDAFPGNVYDIQGYPFSRIDNEIPVISSVSDTVLGDFDNNGEMDVFLLSNTQVRPSGALQASSNVVEGFFTGGVKGITFEGGGTLSIDIDWNRIDNGTGLTRIRIGAAGQPLVFGVPFQLDPNDPDVIGVPAADPVNAPQLRIGLDNSVFPSRWVFILDTLDETNTTVFSSAYVVITGQENIEDLEATGLILTDNGGQPTLLLNDGTDFNDTTAGSGLDEDLLCVSATTGDFDNDMDLDIYVACRGAAGNVSNRYFDNQWDTLGTATFVEVANAGGAGGIVGSNVTDGAGTADSVVVADYDNDGFLDLFVANGFNLRPLMFGGPNQLFRNQGNSNNWLQVDLVGTSGVRNPIGAVVEVTANAVTQTRTYNGKYHRWSQDDQRLHFGLGSNLDATIVVTWQNGITETFPAVSANEVYTITEGTGLAATPPGVGVPYPCGEPEIDAATDSGVFIYKQCFTDAWRVRFVGAGQRIDYAGRLVSDAPLASFNQANGAPNELSNAADPNALMFDITTATGGVRGFNFTPGANVTSHCLDLDIPVGVPVYYGVLRQPVASAPVEIETGEACGALPKTLSIADVSVAESSGVIEFQLTLSEPAIGTENVLVETIDGTATSTEDFTAIIETVTFAAGATSATVSVNLTVDSAAEADESFVLAISAPQGLTLADASASGVITDGGGGAIACGDPGLNTATDPGVFIWQDCGSGIWQFRLSAGGIFSRYIGSITSSDNFTIVTEVSIEANDVVDASSPPSRISYDVRAVGSGQDGFNFIPAAGASVCVDAPNSPQGATFMLGPNRTVVAAPFDIFSGGPCMSGSPTVDVAGTSADESSGSLDFTVSLSQPAAGDVVVSYELIDVTTTVGEDYSAAPSGSASITAGDTSVAIQLTLIDDTLAEGDEIVRLQITNITGATGGQLQADGVIVDNELTLACGEPAIDLSVDSGLFLWRECDTDDWRLQLSAGGAFQNQQGTLTSSIAWDPASVSTLSFEANDTLTVNGLEINYGMQAGNTGRDAIIFQVPGGANVCVGSPNPAGQIFVGENRTLVAGEFDLNTLGVCSGGPPTLTVAGFNESEATGTGQLVVNLSAASSQSISVDYQLVGATALAELDFVAEPSGVITIAPGATQAVLDVGLINDGLAEGAETLQITLSNPVSALLSNTLAVATITDDELSPCGEPDFAFGTDLGHFLWKACDGSGQWFYRASNVAGNTPFFEGTVASNNPIQSIVPFSLESDDVANNNVDPAVLEFSLRTFNAGQDGFDFTPAPNSTACFSVSRAPAGAQVFVGAAKHVLPDAFDLNTLGACGADPEIIVQDASVIEGGTLEFKTNLTFPALDDVSFDYATQDVSAQAGADYTTTSGTLAIVKGSLVASFAVSTLQDVSAESVETLNANLSNPIGALLTQAVATGQIIDDDAVAINTANLQVSEIAGTATVQLLLSEASSLPITVDYSTQGSSALAGADFTGDSGTVTFLAGSVAEQISVAITDDALVEGDEIFFVDLSNPANAVLGNSSVEITIQDDETAPTVSITDVSVSEGSGVVNVAIALSSASANTVRVDVMSNDGSAINGLDYQTVQGTTVTFSPGQVIRTLGVFIIDDSVPEPTESFTLELSNAQGAEIGTGGTGTVTILDDDGALEFSVNDISVSESAGSAAVQILLSVASSASLSVDYSTVAGSAQDGLDYTGVSGTALFAAGETVQTVVVPLINDSDLESLETFELQLSNPVGGVLSSSALAVVSLIDDDSIVCGEPSIDENTETLFALWRDCSTANQWHMRVTSGAFNSYPGQLESSTGFANFSGVSLEPADELFLENSNALSFRLNVSSGGFDGFDVEFNPNAGTCLSVTLVQGAAIVVGSGRTTPASNEFDLMTLGECTIPTLSAQSSSLLETDASGVASVVLSEPSSSAVTFNYQILDGTALADSDFIAVVPGSLTIPAGETVGEITLLPIDDNLVEGPQTLQLELTNVSGAVLSSAVGAITILDDEPSPCGTPNFDSGSQSGIFIYKNCQTTDGWSVRYSSGGLFLRHIGSFEADSAFTSVTPFSIESPSDTLDTSDPLIISYGLNVGNGNLDGFDFELGEGVPMCVRPTTVGGPPIFIGGAQLQVTGPIQLDTLAACAP